MSVAAALIVAAGAAAAGGQPEMVAVLEFKSALKGADREALDAGYFIDQVRAAVCKARPGARVITRENVVALLRS